MFGSMKSDAVRKVEELQAWALNAAVDLRRLSADNLLLHQRHRDDNVEYTRVLTQRDALLEALEKMVAVYSGQVQNDGGYTVLDSVRPLITDQAAIKAVEEKQ